MSCLDSEWRQNRLNCQDGVLPSDAMETQNGEKEPRKEGIFFRTKSRFPTEQFSLNPMKRQSRNRRNDEKFENRKKLEFESLKLERIEELGHEPVVVSLCQLSFQNVENVLDG